MSSLFDELIPFLQHNDDLGRFIYQHQVYYDTILSLPDFKDTLSPEYFREIIEFNGVQMFDYDDSQDSWVIVGDNFHKWVEKIMIFFTSEEDPEWIDNELIPAVLNLKNSLEVKKVTVYEKIPSIMRYVPQLDNDVEEKKETSSRYHTDLFLRVIDGDIPSGSLINKDDLLRELQADNRLLDEVLAKDPSNWLLKAYGLEVEK